MFIFAGCASIDVPNVNEEGFNLEEDEQRILNRSKEAVELLEINGHLYENQELEAYLNSVLQKLIPENVLGHDHLDFHIEVIEDPYLNAFTLHDGHIYIHTGMLALIENESQLAIILAHEMTHVINRHVLKSFRSLKNKTTFFTATLGAFGPFATLGAISSITGYSRALETEADEQGFEVLLNAGYDVYEAPKVFDRMKDFSKDEEIKVPFFFSTHPQLVGRVENLNRLIKENDGRIKPSFESRDARFEALMRPVYLDGMRLWLKNGIFKSSEKYIDSYIERFNDDPNGYYLKGELFRQRQDGPKKKKIRDKTPDYPKAIAAYNKALERDNNFAQSYRGMGRVYQLQDMKEKARQAYKKYLELNPRAADRGYIEKYINSK